jgi:DNA-binding CsgD family transcriptional regulator
VLRCTFTPEASVRRVDVENVAGELSEVIAACSAVHEFRSQTLDLLQRRLGFDCASIQSTNNGSCGAGFDVDDAQLTAMEAAWAQEFNQDELRRMLAARTSFLHEVFPSPVRRARLSVFRGMRNPHAGIGRVWFTGQRVMGIVLTRSGATSGFREQQRLALDRVVPLITVAEALLEKVAPSDALAGWAEQHALTKRQAEVATLVAKGARNAEIARLLRCSELTARNHVAAVFRKVRVASRAELTHEALTPQGGTREIERAYRSFVARVHTELVAVSRPETRGPSPAT